MDDAAGLSQVGGRHVFEAADRGQLRHLVQHAGGRPLEADGRGVQRGELLVRLVGGLVVQLVGHEVEAAGHHVFQ